jgi:hypothetical protein
MDAAPQAIEPVLVPSAPAVDALPPTSAVEIDRVLAALAERATPFARLPPREKAALLRAAIPRIRAVAPEMVSLTCHAAGVDPASPLAGTAWLAGPVALIAAVRRFAEALDDVAASGRPSLSSSKLRGRIQGRLVAQLEPRGFAERAFHRGAEVTAVFAEGVLPEDVISGQAAFYRRSNPEGAVARVVTPSGGPAAGPLAALEALFVEGQVAMLETSPARAWLGPLVEQALAPLIEAGFLHVVQGSEVRATPGGDGGPVLVVPAYFSKGELWFIARRIAAEVAAGAAFGLHAPREIVVAGCWAQKELFLDNVRRALAAAWFQGTPYTLAPPAEDDAAPPARTLRVIEAGCDDAVAMLAAATDRCNARPDAPAAAEIIAHVVHEEDPDVAAAIDRASVRLRAGVVGVNRWPAWVSFRGDPAPYLLPRVDKVIVRSLLRTERRPFYAADDVGAPQRGAKLFSFLAAPTLGALARGVGT